MSEPKAKTLQCVKLATWHLFEKQIYRDSYSCTEHLSQMVSDDIFTIRRCLDEEQKCYYLGPINPCLDVQGITSSPCHVTIVDGDWSNKEHAMTFAQWLYKQPGHEDAVGALSKYIKRTSLKAMDLPSFEARLRYVVSKLGNIRLDRFQGLPKTLKAAYSEYQDSCKQEPHEVWPMLE